MRSILIVILFFIAALFHAQEVNLNIDLSKKQKTQPEFPGGQDSLKKFIQRNLVFPEAYQNMSGFKDCHVHVKFNISSNGSLNGIKISKGCLGYDKCDLEAIRLVKMMPA